MGVARLELEVESLADRLLALYRSDCLALGMAGGRGAQAEVSQLSVRDQKV